MEEQDKTLNVDGSNENNQDTNETNSEGESNAEAGKTYTQAELDERVKEQDKR